jgi:hypothetical protein
MKEFGAGMGRRVGHKQVFEGIHRDYFLYFPFLVLPAHSLGTALGSAEVLVPAPSSSTPI